MYPSIFKYGSIVSLPLFGFMAFVLINKVDNFFLSKQKISKLVHFIENSRHLLIFRLSFIIKSFLDLCFGLYVIQYFKLSYFSPLAILFFISSALFASLSYFTDKAFYRTHKFIVYLYGFILALTQIYLSYIIGDISLIILAYSTAFISSALAFYALVNRKTNVYIQIVCTSLLYIWLVILVFRYL